MERVATTNVDTLAVDSNSFVRRLSDSVGAERVVVNQYRLAPGDGFPSGIHAHADQEEVFVVLDGEATFETCPSPVSGNSGGGQEFAVRAGECVHFAPMEFQSGRNAGSEESVALAIGAPADSQDVRIPFACPDCGDATLALDFEDEFGFACPACDCERVPADCPDCGHGDLRATLNDRNDVVAACTDCGTEHDHPPVLGDW